MSERDHERHREEVGAYLLSALSEPERHAFEHHLAECVLCQDEVERLRPAAEALPRSVEQMEPPPSLKASLMEAVGREAGVGSASPRPRLADRLRALFSPVGRARPLFAAGALALGLLAGYGVAQVVSSGDERRLAADVDVARVPSANASLRLHGDGEDGAILRVHGLPDLPAGRVYQAWVRHDRVLAPQPTFEVGADGAGAVAVPDDLSEADAVLVTREPQGGARAPSEMAIISVDL